VRTAVDTNVISALWSREPSASRMVQLLGRAQSEGGLVIAAAVYAELLAHPGATGQFVDEFLISTRIALDFDLGESVWRDAAGRFATYAERRRRSGGGSPKRLLVDFLIGAHAALKADRLLTLDANRYREDFPNLRLM
jgi:predicted nucleic acid-binding protein